MVKTSIRNNIISIIRDPTTLLAILAAIILCFMDGLGGYIDGNGNRVDTELYLSSKALSYMLGTMMGWVSIPIRKMLFPFVGIVVACNLFKDKNTNAYDIISSGQISFAKYYLSKIISYYLVSIGLCLLLTVSFGSIYTFVYIPSNANFAWETIIISQIIAMFVFYTSSVLIPIAMVVFFTAVLGTPIIGVIINCIYQFIPNMIYGFSYSFLGHYVHVYPMALYLYLKDWVLYPLDERFSLNHQQIYGDLEPYLFHTSFPEAVFTYGLQIGIATVLFLTSYFLLKWRFQKS